MENVYRISWLERKNSEFGGICIGGINGGEMRAGKHELKIQKWTEG